MCFRLHRFWLVLSLFAANLMPAGAAAENYRYIIKYRPGAVSSAVRAASTRAGDLETLGGRHVEDLTLINAQVYEFSNRPDAQALDSLQQRKRDEIQYIEPDYRVEAYASTPNDRYFGYQWGLENTAQFGGTADVDIDAVDAWQYISGSRKVIVAVLDTGIDYNHPDLAGNLWTNPRETAGNGRDDDGNGFADDLVGVNIVTGSGDPRDDNGHGTHVAGIIGAVGNNGGGVSGVNWLTAILSVKVLDKEGSGYTSSIVRGIQYIIDLKTQQGADIAAINASLGCPQYSAAMYDAIERAEAAGILVVAAAGNEGKNNDEVPSYPANYDRDNVISVAAIDEAGRLADFSNYGFDTVDIAAPGVDIASTYPTDLVAPGSAPYVYLDGTSMAAPFVTGVAALLHARTSDLPYRVVRRALIWGAKTARDIPAFNESLVGKIGYPGMVSAYGALSYIDTYSWDTDGDGVSDTQEEQDRTNPEDRGSSHLHLESPAFTKFNTFLNQSNFLELISAGSEQVRAEVNIFRIDGTLAGTVTLHLDPGQQFHVDINSYVNQKDTYGLVRVDFNKNNNVRLVGRMSHYRPAASGTDFAFAFTREFRNPLRGRSFATSNSYDPQGGSNTVANWAELINLEDRPKTFTHLIYSQEGYLLYSRKITVPALGELDVQAGHEYGVGVYLNEFVPQDDNAKYFASISRYRINEWGTDYSYALTLDAEPGSGSEKYVATFNQRGTCWSETNWIEVVNVTAEVAPVTVMLRDQEGNLLGSQALNVPPKAQIHVNAGALLPVGQAGWASVTPWRPESIIAQGLVYYHDCQMNVLQTAFALPARVKYHNDLQGTFNRFLGLKNMVSLINPLSDDWYSPGTLKLHYPQDSIYFEVRLPPLASLFEDVNTLEPWTQQTYGTLELEAFTQADGIVAHNLLTRERADGRMNFVIPTIVR